MQIIRIYNIFLITSGTTFPGFKKVMLPPFCKLLVLPLWLTWDSRYSPRLDIDVPAMCIRFTFWYIYIYFLSTADSFLHRQSYKSFFSAWASEFKAFIMLSYQGKDASILSLLLSLHRCIHTSSLSKTLFLPQYAYCLLQTSSKGPKTILLYSPGWISSFTSSWKHLSEVETKGSGP